MWHLSTGVLLPSISKNDWQLLVGLLKQTKMQERVMIGRTHDNAKHHISKPINASKNPITSADSESTKGIYMDL